MADVEIEEILRKPDHYVSEKETALEIENLVTSVLIDKHKSSTKFKGRDDDDTRIEKEADKEAATEALKEARVEEHEEQVEGDYLQLAADMVAAAAVMDNFYVDDLEMMSTNDFAEHSEENSEDAENRTSVDQDVEEVDSRMQEYAETESNKSKRVFAYFDSDESLLDVDFDLEESSLDEDAVGLDVNAEEEEEDITVSDADMKNAHYVKMTADGVVDRRHDVDLVSEHALRAEAMKQAEAEMEKLEKETKDAEGKIEAKEAKLWKGSSDRLAEKLEKKEAGDDKGNNDGANKEGSGETHKTEFVCATIEKLCFEMEDGLVWRKTHTKKRIRKKILSPGGISDEDDELR